MNVFILTGAGVSAESGLGTFRDAANGLWARFDPMKLATPEAFAQDPELVHAFYNARRRNLLDSAPNAAHVALARLEREMTQRGARLDLVTQNIDDLHERGGSARVVYMHGELLKARCVHCGALADCRDDLSTQRCCAACAQSGGMRPHVVWFGEVPMHLDEIYAALAEADLFVAIGTSGAVYPAAQFVAEARRHGALTCEINLDPADNAQIFDERRYGKASEAVPAFVDEFLARL